jgi:hypothetical protein
VFENARSAGKRLRLLHYGITDDEVWAVGLMRRRDRRLLERVE